MSVCETCWSSARAMALARFDCLDFLRFSALSRDGHMNIHSSERGFFFGSLKQVTMLFVITIFLLLFVVGDISSRHRILPLLVVSTLSLLFSGALGMFCNMALILLLIREIYLRTTGCQSDADTYRGAPPMMPALATPAVDHSPHPSFFARSSSSPEISLTDFVQTIRRCHKTCLLHD